MLLLIAILVLAIPQMPAGSWQSADAVTRLRLDWLDKGWTKLRSWPAASLACLKRPGGGHPFDILNERLCARTQSQDPVENLNLTLKWFNESRSRQKLGSNGQSRFEALKLVAGLEQLRLDNEFCSKKSSDYFKQIESQLAEHVSGLESGRRCRRVLDIYAHFTARHSSTCAPVYRAKLALVSAALAPSQISLVNESLAKLFHQSPGAVVGLDSVRLVRAVGDAQLGDMVAYSLLHTSRLHQDGWDRTKVEATLDECLGAPCAYLTDKLADVFAPATYDLATLDLKRKHLAADEHDRRALEELGGSGSDFYSNWTTYLVCERLATGNKQQLANKLLQLLEHANNVDTVDQWRTGAQN